MVSINSNLPKVIFQTVEKSVDVAPVGEQQPDVPQVKPSAVWFGETGKDGKIIIGDDYMAGDVVIGEDGKIWRVKVKRNGDVKLIRVNRIRQDDYEYNNGDATRTY